MVKALVIKTAFTTLKGGLVRDVLYPRPTKFKFYRDSMIFLGIMGLIGILGMIILIPVFIIQEFGLFDVFDRTANVIVTIVPPFLPSAMTVGVIFAVKRLKK